MSSIIWKNQENEWLIIDTTRTHTKFEDTYSFTKDINKATSCPYLSAELRTLRLKPVLVRITRKVTIID